MRAPLARFLRDRRAAAGVEFAFIVPVMLLMTAGVYEIGRIFQSQSAANKIASQYAIAYADCVDLPAGTCKTELSLYTSTYGLKNLAPELTNATTIQLFQVAMSGTTPNVTYSYPNGASLTPAQSTAASNVLTDGQSGVIVTVNYTYTMDMFPSALSKTTLPASWNFAYTVVQLKA